MSFIHGYLDDGREVDVRENDHTAFYAPRHWTVTIGGEEVAVRRIDRLRDGGSTTLKLVDGRRIHRNFQLRYREKGDYPEPTLTTELRVQTIHKEKP